MVVFYFDIVFSNLTLYKMTDEILQLLKAYQVFTILLLKLEYVSKHCKNFLAFTGPRRDFADFKHDYTQKFYRSYSV